MDALCNLYSAMEKLRNRRESQFFSIGFKCGWKGKEENLGKNHEASAST